MGSRRIRQCSKCLKWVISFKLKFRQQISLGRGETPWILICIPSCRADGVMRTMAPEKLLKSMPILQEQIDALLEFDVCIEADPALTLGSDL